MENSNKKRHDRLDQGRKQSTTSGGSQSAVQSQAQILAGSRASAHSQALFLQKLKDSSDAVNRGDFQTAIQAYTDAINLDPSNHILYTNRSVAYSKVQQFQRSLLDARKARELNPKWAKAYLREGTALQQLGQHADALAAFASGLAQDANNTSLLSGLTEAALKCPLKEKLEPVFQQLQKLKLDKSPFVTISVIGQELLQAGHYHASTQMLESALKIGSCSLKLRGSVYSALSSACWGLGNIDSAIQYMQRDLQVAKKLGDTEGECRAYGNLGSAYFSKGHYKEALSHDRFQLVLAMRLKDRQTATIALGRLGHVYTAIGDYPNALQSHKQSVLLLKQSNEKLSEAREIGNVGAVYLAMGNFESAVECHLEHLNIAKGLKNSVEEARALSNLGSAYHYKRDYLKAMTYHKQVLKIAEQKGDKSLEARAYAGLGHAARCTQDYDTSKTFHEKQLDNALQTRDKVAEGRACSNLGIIYHQLGEYEAALKLHKVHLSIAKGLGDRASQGRALGNIGNAYSALKKYDQAIKYHKQELAISTEVNDRHSEGSTHGNLAVAYQAMKMMDSAHQHYVAHLNISRELKDPNSEGRAVCNLGNFHSSRGEYANSIPYYEQYLMLSQELHDSEGEAKACFCLGYSHFALGNFQESVHYYEQDLLIAQEMKDQLGIARAYCNLGLAHKALGNLEEALECQKKCLNLMTTLKNVKGRFRSMGNIGDILLKTGDTSEAIKFYNQQLQLAKQCNSRDMLAAANGALGAAHRTLTQYDKALGFHTQELSIRQDMNDLQGECRAHGNLGSVHMCLGKYMNAFKCYEEQLEKSRELQDSAMEANACGNLAITKMNMGNFEEAIGLFEQQLAMLEQVHGNSATFDKGRAFGNLGDCYEALGDFDESIKCHEQYLAIAQNAGKLCDQDKAYRGLGNAHRSVGNLQQALVCFEKRLVVAHELNSANAKASAYGELGCLHSLLGNFEQAISCLQHQLEIAREILDSLCEGEAACGLGGVYQQMGEYNKALEYHEMDLKIAEKTKNTACQCRAYGNLGLSHESLGEYEKAIRYQEQHLSIAAQMNDRVAKTLAYSSLGRVHHALNNHPQAVEYLRLGLQIAEQLGRMEDEAKIRHRLGLALWGKGDFEECQQQLYKASELFESIRRDAQFNSEYKLSLFDLQTACYQALQRVLVTLDRHQEALVVAERACTRAFIDLLMERQAGSEGFYGNHVTDPPPITTDQITSIVGKQKSLVLYLSVAAGFLYSWLLTPKDGVVKFHETSMADVENEVDGGDNISMKSSISFSTCSLLDNFVGQIRESMGVESHAPSGIYKTMPRSMSLDNDSDVEDQWEQHLEELGDKLNAENDRTGFLRIVNRNHLFNSSNYSLGSLFSVSASLNGCNASFPGAGVSRKNSMRNKFGNKSAISALYQLLIEPFEESMKSMSEEYGQAPLDLIIVLQGDLYLIPFSVLRKDQTMEYLFERFNLMVVPSLTSLQNVSKHDKNGRPVIDSSGAVVVGNPKLTPSICQHWHLHDIPASEYEARIVGEILTARPFIGHEATKVAVLNQLEQVEVIHFAAHISWKLSSVILSPGEVPSHPARFPTIDSDDSSSDISSFDGPSLAEYLLTAADILNLKLHAKLVVLSAGYTDDRAGRINSDGVVGLTRSLLSAGAQCVIYCLWPVPDQASKLLMRTLYVGLQEGKSVSQALSFAVKTVQSTKQFSHPSNWGGWVLMGQDVKLSSKVAQMGHAICELLQHPSQCREAMRVLLHLIEKSLQRIHQGMKNSMYTTAQSIENKVSGLSGWKDLLQAVGFRFEPSLNGLPPAVFFPQSDPGDRLTQASASLQALLGLPHGSIQALSKFLANYEAGEAIIRVMRDILSKMAAKDNNMDVKVNVKLWRIPGCHEFLASLSMDLVDVGNDEITLRLGKQANKRHLQFALQALVSVFDTQEAPRSLALDSSSSLESLSSSHSGSTSTSNFSKGSTPPLSPRSKKRSLFNPAEMEKMRIRNSRMSQGGLTGRKLIAGRSARASVSDPAVCLQYQNQIKNMYRTGGVVSPAGSNDVYVTGLSDSDTQTSCVDSPTLGSSSASEKFKSLSEVENYDLNFDGKSDKSDTKSGVSESKSGRSSSNEETVIVNNGREVISEVTDERNAFKRNSENRNSDISDNSSVSQGIQADSDKRGSDMSDLSAHSESHLTSRNQHDLEAFLATTDESGIVSETTSNQSEGSQQSDPSSYKFDPTMLAHKIMTDVSEHKLALDSFQKMSMIQTQMESDKLRADFVNQSMTQPAAGDVQSSNVPCSTQDTSNVSEKISSVQSKIQTFSATPQSAFTSPTHHARTPPSIPSKPTFQSSASNFRNLSSKVSNLSNIPSSVETTATSMSNKGPGSSLTENYQSTESVSEAKVFTTQAILVSKKDSFSSSGSANTTMSFSSFRPPNRPSPAESMNSFSSGQYRPDSETSTSSYCSTPSSVRSVIYRPYGNDVKLHGNDSPYVGSYDSSSEQTSGSGSASTLTPTLNLGEIQGEVSAPKRDASPSLSTGSSASSKSGKQKKKVSFSDSEPSETPSPLNISASSNQISYFDLNNSNIGNVPHRAGGGNLLQQSASQNTSNSSIDSVGRGTAQPRPSAPPSYQYAIKNSHLIKHPLGDLPEHAKPVTNFNQSVSSTNPSMTTFHCPSNSSLNSSLEEIQNVQQQSPSAAGMSPRRFAPNLTSAAPSMHYQTGSPTHKFPVTASFNAQIQQGITPIGGNQSGVQTVPDSSPNYQNVPIVPQQKSQFPVSNSTFQQGSPHAGRSSNKPAVPVRITPQVSRPSTISLSGPMSPSRSHFSPARTQNTGGLLLGGQAKPPFSPSKTALLREPLSPDSSVNVQESFPPPPPQFRAAEDQLSALIAGTHTGSTNNQAYSQNHHGYHGEGQGYQRLNNPLSHSAATRNYTSLNHALTSNKYDQTNPHQAPISQNSGMTSFSSQNNYLRDTSRQLPGGGPQFHQIHNTAGNQNKIPQSPVRKNPPVPPARIDSWENMDRHMTSYSSQRSYDSGNYAPQTGSVNVVAPMNMANQSNIRSPVVPSKGQMYTNGSVPSANSAGKYTVYPPRSQNGAPMFRNQQQGPQMTGMESHPRVSHELTNGSAGNDHSNLGQPAVGPLRRINLGSDKKSFAKTNVIQASKC